MTAIAVSALPLPLLHRGKVRDVYAVGTDRLLLLATDRVSAFDVVMAETVPHKGAVLTQLTAWWLGRLQGIVENHLISADAGAIIAEVPELAAQRETIEGRAMLCRRTHVHPVECVVRGYLAGSAWKEYSESGTLAGEPLPAGLRESDRLDPPIFSPATKAQVGHDENITTGRMSDLVGAETAEFLERASRTLYTRAAELALDRGIIIADTKFEFGRAADGSTLLIDEVLTPDSSRFWDAGAYRPGGPQPSFDKQPLRDHLEFERRSGRWDGEPPPPPLPDIVVQSMSARYLDAFERLTGAPLHRLPT